MKKLLNILIFLSFPPFLFAHEQHAAMVGRSENFNRWMQWLGGFHLIFLHFPIALVVMTVISECLYLRYKNLFFDHASRFMLITAAIATLPTVLTGLAFSYRVSYEGYNADLFWWHRFLGFFIAVTAFLAVTLKELTARKVIRSTVYYFICLAILFISVNVTGYIGGELTFGQQNLLPPIAKQDAN